MASLEVDAWCDEESEVQATAKIFAGLVSLERAGALRLRLRAARGGGGRTVRLDLHRGGETRRIAIDLADQARLIDRAAFDAADAYFKRSFEPAALTPEVAARVRPFGLLNPVATPGTRRRLASARLRLGASRRRIGELRHLAVLPSASAFERPPQAPAEPAILYQVRLWDPKPGRPDLDACLEQRVSLVRNLRAAFGRRFLGGLMPTPLARERFPELLTPLPSGMRAWPELVTRPLVAVSSEGLHGSIGYKLGEYLGASLAIVADRLPATLPEPLVEGAHYLAYRTPDECVARCERLLSDPASAGEMRERNWTYYRSQVEPAAQMRRVIEAAFAEPRR